MDKIDDDKVQSGGSSAVVAGFPIFGSTSTDSTELRDRVAYALNHRRLNARQVQLTSMAGAIGALLFVGIGSGVRSGPLALLIGFLFWASVVFGIAQCQLEIVSLLPLDGSFIRLAGRMIDPAVGVAVGWNYFFAMTSYVAFEATILNTLVQYWGYDASPAILITVALVIFFAINIYRADLFGEAEFWLALFKVLLALGLIVFTFITMVGGNPLHDRFGFRYWKDPGPWAGDSSATRLMSFVNSVNVAGFCIAGPEYISIIAGEAKDPRKTISRAFRTIMARLLVFFIGGAICVGILVPSNDPTLTTGAGTYAGNSPYVIAMTRLQIPVLPDIVNAILITVAMSAGNAYTFGASRALHAMALDRRAPKFLCKTNKKGVPYYCVIVVMLLASLSYLALGSGSAVVLNWILNFCTAASMFNWLIMSITWIRFNSAMKAQGIDRDEFLTARSRYQPFAGYWAAVWSFVFLWVQGYAVFLKGNWDVPQFIFNYGIIALCLLIGLGFKVFGRTPFHRSKMVDLSTDLDLFEALDAEYQSQRDEAPEKGVKAKVLRALFPRE